MWLLYDGRFCCVLVIWLENVFLSCGVNFFVLVILVSGMTLQKMA